MPLHHFLLPTMCKMLLPILSPPAAIHKLRQYKKIGSPREAIAYLEEQQLTYRLLLIYQHFFPNQFARSTAPNYPQNLKEPEPHSPKEIELFHLIDENLFPINVWYHTSVQKVRMYGIPLMTNGIDWQAEDFDITTLKLGWQALIALSYHGRYWLEPEEYSSDCPEDDSLSWYESTTGVPLRQIAHPDRINPDLLSSLCSQAAHPIKLLPLAIQLLEHTTGNIWLDMFEYELETGEKELEWTLENIEFLASEYQRASEIWQQANLLIDWLESDLTANLKQGLKIWNRSSLPK